MQDTIDIVGSHLTRGSYHVRELQRKGHLSLQGTKLLTKLSRLAKVMEVITNVGQSIANPETGNPTLFQ